MELYREILTKALMYGQVRVTFENPGMDVGIGSYKRVFFIPFQGYFLILGVFFRDATVSSILFLSLQTPVGGATGVPGVQ